MPSPPESSAIENAMIRVLRNDAELAALMPDGVWYEQAPPGSQRFVIVSLVDSIDVPTFTSGAGTRRAYEDVLYLVKAVALSSSGTAVNDAAARIDVLLEDAVYPIAGFGLMTSHRVNRRHWTERDDLDPDILWQQAGGQYRVQAALLN